MMMRRTFALVFVLAALGPARADDDDGAWRVLTLPDRPAAAFDVRDDGSIVVRADGAVAFLYRPVDLGGARTLAWRWRVDRGFQPVALDRPGDDRPLAVHVWVPPDGLFGALETGFAGIIGYPAIGHALTYVWGGTAERGAWFPNPYLDGGVIAVLRSGATPMAAWYEETVDIKADFEAAFGFVPTGTVYVVVSADTDDTGASSEGTVADLRLVEGAP